MTPLDEEVARAMGWKEDRSDPCHPLWIDPEGTAFLHGPSASTSWEDFGAALSWIHARRCAVTLIIPEMAEETIAPQALIFDRSRGDKHFIAGDGETPMIAFCRALSSWAKSKGGDAGLRGKDGR